jgi:hypothetical protein
MRVTAVVARRLAKFPLKTARPHKKVPRVRAPSGLSFLGRMVWSHPASCLADKIQSLV